MLHSAYIGASPAAVAVVQGATCVLLIYNHIIVDNRLHWCCSTMAAMDVISSDHCSHCALAANGSHGITATKCKAIKLTGAVLCTCGTVN
jgi:hypothetical protein